MAFTGSFTTDAFKVALLTRYCATRTFMIALYDTSATLNAQTSAYTATNEVSGTGYTAGGETIAAAVTLVNGAAVLAFSAPTWTAASFSARGAMIYDSTTAGNPSVYIGDFGAVVTKTAADFVITMPVADEVTGLIVLKV